MNRNTILVIWLGWHQLIQYLRIWRWQKFQFFHALMLLSVLKAVIWRGIITSSQPGTTFETVEADICSCWALGQCTLIHGREKCHYSQRVFSSCICHLSLSISITHKEQAQGMAIMFTLLTIYNLPNTRYLFLLYNGLVMKQATKNTHCMLCISGPQTTLL